MLGHCYSINARQKFLNNALAPDGALALFGIFGGRLYCNNALALGIYYYRRSNKYTLFTHKTL